MAFELTSQDWKELWDIVRATERQASVQSETLKGLGEKLDAQQCLSDRYFETMDKRDAETARKFDEHLKLQRERDVEQSRRFDALIAAQEKREEKFWKVIAILIGAMMCLVLGKTAAEKIFDTYRDPAKAVVYSDMIPYADPRHWIPFTKRTDV